MSDERAKRAAEALYEWHADIHAMLIDKERAIAATAPLVAAEYADVIAENERLKAAANARLCAACLEQHPIDSMCPPHECRTTGQQWFRERIATIEQQVADLREKNQRLSTENTELFKSACSDCQCE